MEYKKLILLSVLFGLLIILLVLFFMGQGKEKTPEIASSDLLDKGISGQQEMETKPFVLFFLSEEDSWLHKEEREISIGTTLEHQIERIIEELIRGSEKGLLSPIPTETKIRGIYITKKGVVYVDFSPEFQKDHSSGSSAEISSIFSIVNSIAYNFQSIKKVFILINGTEQETLAGHIDLRRPFLPRYELIVD